MLFFVQTATGYKAGLKTANFLKNFCLPVTHYKNNLLNGILCFGITVLVFCLDEMRRELSGLLTRVLVA